MPSARVTLACGVLSARPRSSSVERACYVLIARAPGVVSPRCCARPRSAWLGEPVAVVRGALLCLQGRAVRRLRWLVLRPRRRVARRRRRTTSRCSRRRRPDGRRADAQPRRLLPARRVGVFFGDRWVTRCRGAARFRSLVSHPQYVGDPLTIWGFFLAMRLPRRLDPAAGAGDGLLRRGSLSRGRGGPPWRGPAAPQSVWRGRSLPAPGRRKSRRSDTGLERPAIGATARAASVPSSGSPRQPASRAEGRLAGQGRWAPASRAGSSPAASRSAKASLSSGHLGRGIRVKGTFEKTSGGAT